MSSSNITYISEPQLSIHVYQARLPIFGTSLGHHPIGVGIPWLKQDDITIRFSSNLGICGSQYSLPTLITEQLQCMEPVKTLLNPLLPMLPQSASQSLDLYILSESHGIIMHYSMSYLYNTTSLTHLCIIPTVVILRSDMGPYYCLGLGSNPASAFCEWSIRAWQDRGSGLEPNRIGMIIALVLRI
jgi:hypothetical protein